MFIDKPSKKLLLSIVLSATNIASFAFGVTLAGAREGAAVDVVAAPVQTTASPSPKPSPKPSLVVKATPRPAAPAAAAVAAPVAPDPVIAPAADGASPIAGKGMWIYEFDLIAKGNVQRIVSAAKSFGMTHLYVRAGTSRSGLNTWPDIARILPAAHAAGLKVIPWFFVYLKDPAKDVQRTISVLRANVGGHRIDGFAADIETRAEGTHLSTHRMKAYIDAINRVHPEAYMILVPPRPNMYTVQFYPFHLTPRFDAVAPMVYWGGNDPAKATRDAVLYLKQYGRPVAPIGQVYDMAPEGGPKGRPKPPALRRFMNEARGRGAVGFSFWSWQHSDLSQWHAIKAFPWP